MRQDVSPETRAGYAARLPLRLRERLMDHYARNPQLDPAFAAVSLARGEPEIRRRPTSGEMHPGTEEKGKPKSKHEGVPAEHLSAFWLAAVQRDDFRTILLQQIADTVKGPAWAQSLKGVYTAGLGRTAKYVLAKAGKWWEGRKG